MKKSNEQTTGQSGVKMKSTYELNQLGANIVGNPKRLDMTDRLIAEINNHFSTEIYKHFMKNEQEQSAQFLPSRQHAWT